MKQIILNNRVHYSKDQHLFYKPNRSNYTRYGFQLGQSISSDKNTNSTQKYLEKSSSYSTTVDGAIGKGYGRIDNVTDMATALFLIQDLQRKGNLKSLSQTQLENVARSITQVNNTRFLDFRFSLIDQISMLDSLLKKQNIQIDSELIYYTSLYDNWLYARRANRSTGSQWLISLDFSVGRSRDIDINENLKDEYSLNQYLRLNNRAGININYNRYHQKSMHVQNHFQFISSSQLMLGDNRHKYIDSSATNPKNESNTTFKNDQLSSRIEFNYRKLYQPNSRNYHTLSLSNATWLINQLYNLRTSSTSNPRSEGQYTSNTSRIGYQYFKFFSPRLTFEFGATLSLTLSRNVNKTFHSPGTTTITNYKSVRDDLSFYPNLSAQLNYAIF